MHNNNHNIVLMVENNLDHIELALDAFSETGLPFSIKVLQSENEALEYLIRTHTCRNPEKTPIPQAIMIDVQVSGWQGFHLLEKIHADNTLPHIPVIMLSSSVNPNDANISSKLGAEDIMLKPLHPIHIEKQFKKLGLA